MDREKRRKVIGIVLFIIGVALMIAGLTNLYTSILDRDRS